MDTGGNGAVDAEEHRVGVRRSLETDADGFLGRMGTLMQEWTTLCDTDGNGVLSRDEISAAVLEYFTSEEPRSPGNWPFGSA
ncbi:hypothetical protein [Streptomyces sp. NRRL S-448]|uniref:hypothetical protein n=1 Tax=Streptomyces sp. NRRL S-448 TaxID=1463907 RepID=UPI000AA95664